MLLISKLADIADLFMHAKEGDPVAWGVRSVNVAQS